jgi:glycosyltransferase involved in cell wall biosynthesis
MAVDHAPNTTSLLENLEPAEASLPMASVFGAATAALPTGRGVVVALLPAHNEEDEIEAAICSLRQQKSSPDLIVVIADNCTDGTREKAEAAGAFVFETVGNVHKKAGALNQVLDLLLPKLRDEDAVLVMDADSRLAPTFLAEALRRLRNGVGGVGGVFTGRSGGGFVGMLQRNEYARYARRRAAERESPRTDRHGDAVLRANASARRLGAGPSHCCPAARRRSTTRTSSQRTTS